MLRLAAIPALLVPVILAAQPPKRAHHSIAYDPVRERVIMSNGSSPFEGGNCCAMFNDVWTFDGARWVSLGESGTKLSGATLAFDSRRQLMLSFGAYLGSAGSAGELRILEGSAWRTLGSHPELRIPEPGFVYDSRRDRFVSFGGSTGRGSASGDTWEYDGARWTKAAVTNPPARSAHAMVFDERRGVTVVFGGSGVAAQAQPNQPNPPLADLWEYDGTAWTQKTVSGPPGRLAAGITYDSKRGLVILFGGFGADGVLGDTWAWNGTAWRKLADTGPEARGMGYLAYDARRDRVVLFGGRKGWPNDLNDTWEWDGTTWRQVAIAP
jgi:hypothetical protein